MTAYHYRFENVLVVRDQEKSEMELAFKESVRHFEDVATKLYDMLKKKEDVLASQHERMTIGFSVNDIHHFSRFISGLEKSIADLQQKVVQARSKMNWHEEKLVEKTLEVRKYEKMKEKDLNAYKTEQERIEMNQLDELSSLKYRTKEIR
ncbi:MAG: flagellar export protein FliJ [Paenisporosarcina sp.]